MNKRKKHIVVSESIFDKVDNFRLELEKTFNRRISMGKALEVKLKIDDFPDTFVVQKSTKKRKEPLFWLR